MTEHLLNVTFKPNGDPLITVHADTPQEFEQAVGEVTGSIGDLIAQAAVAVDAHFRAARELGATTIAQAPPAPAPVAAAPQPADPAPWDQPQAQAPAYAQPAPPQPAAPAAAPGAAVPGVTFYEAPNPDPAKAQYTELFVKFPYIQDAAQRTAFNGQLKSQFRARWSPEQKAWFMNRNNRAAVEALFAQNAHLFQ